MQTSDFSKNFLNFVRNFQERNKFIVRAYGLDLLPVESHILTELDIHGDLTGRELAKFLDIDPARVSMLLKGLAKRKMISRTVRENDALRKPFELTKKGREILRDHDKHADRQLEQMAKQLSRDDVSELADFFLSLSDSVKAPHSHRRRGEHPLRFLARRLTRWLGQLGNDFYYSGLSPLEWHILLAVKEGAGETINSHLVNRFEASKQAISKCLKKMCAEKIIVAQASPVDGRQRAYRVTAKGDKILADLNQRAQKAVSSAMVEIPPKSRKSRVIDNAYKLVGLRVQ